MQAFILHFNLEFWSGIRNRTLLLMHYLMPIGFYLLVGTMMAEINPFFGDQMIPAMVAFAILSAAIMGLPGPMIEAREGQVLRNYRVHGVRAATLLAIPALSTAVHIGVTALIIGMSAPLLFDAPVPASPLAFAGVTIAFTLASVGLGSLIGVLSANSRVAILWQQAIYLPSMILGGLMIPLEVLPDTFARIAHLLPATYAMQAYFGLAYGEPTPYASLYAVAILVTGAITAFALAGTLFRWDDRDGGRLHPAAGALALLPYVLGAWFLVGG